MTPRTLSSKFTFPMKFVFPVFWISAFGIGTAMMWSGPAVRHVGVPTDALQWVFLAIWLLGTAFVLWTCVPLKYVRVDDTSIHVSNYIREARISLESIDEVTENRWINIHPVTIRFRYTTDFGDRIKFMPKTRMLGFWTSHPVVAELRQLAKNASR
jgi:hypothetical protein